MSDGVNTFMKRKVGAKCSSSHSLGVAKMARRGETPRVTLKN